MSTEDLKMIVGSRYISIVVDITNITRKETFSIEIVSFFFFHFSNLQRAHQNHLVYNPNAIENDITTSMCEEPAGQRNIRQLAELIYQPPITPHPPPSLRHIPLK